jgi:nitrate reductase NapE component
MTEATEKPAEPARVQESEKSAAKEARTRGQRSLFIMVMLMFFVSIVVFVVGTYFFIIPHLVTQDLEIRHLQNKLSAFESALTAPVEEEAPPVAPGAPEVEPAGGSQPPSQSEDQPEAEK